MHHEYKYYLLGVTTEKDTIGYYHRIITEFGTNFKSLRKIAKDIRRRYDGHYQFKIYRINPREERCW